MRERERKSDRAVGAGGGTAEQTVHYIPTKFQPFPSLQSPLDSSPPSQHDLSSAIGGPLNMRSELTLEPLEPLEPANARPRPPAYNCVLGKFGPSIVAVMSRMSFGVASDGVAHLAFLSDDCLSFEMLAGLSAFSFLCVRQSIQCPWSWTFLSWPMFHCRTYSEDSTCTSSRGYLVYNTSSQTLGHLRSPVSFRLHSSVL